MHGLVLVLLVGVGALCSANGLSKSITSGHRDMNCTRSQVFPNRTEVKLDCSRRNLTSSQLCEICGNTTSMRNVIYLDVGGNKISILQDRFCLRGCSGLKSLDLNDNNLTTISEDAFENMGGLERLDLSFNNLHVYKKDTGKLFKSLRRLHTLKLNGNIVNKSAEVYYTYSYPDLSNVTSLVNLSMDGLRYATFDMSFTHLKNLTGLFLSGLSGTCDLGILYNGFFECLQNLTDLDLSFCSISNIDYLTFALPKLRWLDLSHNQQLGFETLNNVSFGLQYSDIKFLNYSYVYVTFRTGTVLMKRHICYLFNTRLEELALDNNNIEEFETNLPLLFPPTLKIIHVNFNMFRFGPYIFQIVCMPTLTELHGSYRNVGRNLSLYFQETPFPPNIEYSLGICPYMESDVMLNRSTTIENCMYIDFSFNSSMFRPSVPKALKKLIVKNSALKYEVSPLLVLPPNNIEYMDFSENTLFSWIGPMLFFDKVQTLDLSKNYCSNISNIFFKAFIGLENLQLSNNMIGFTLEESNDAGPFQDLHNLKTLNLSLNRISTMPPDALSGLTSLETIVFSFNNIQEWMLEVDNLSNLSHVNLSHNSLQMLPMFLTDHLSTVSKQRGIPFTLDLQYNNLKLSCDSLTFLKWLVANRNNCVGFDQYTFVNEDGAIMNNVNIAAKLDDYEKKCQSNVVWIVLSTIGVSTCLSIVIGGMIYRNRWKLRYLLYMSRQRFYGYVRIPDQEPLENFRYNAFISYADESLRFVKNELIPRLEDGDTRMNLCVHQRDFLPGNTIAENIVDAIQSSRKIVILLNRAFLKKRWCVYEFNMARMENIYKRDGRSCIVIVMLEPIPAKAMPLEMLELVKTESYIEYQTDVEDQDLFWDNLRDAILA